MPRRRVYSPSPLVQPEAPCELLTSRIQLCNSLKRGLFIRLNAEINVERTRYLDKQVHLKDAERSLFLIEANEGRKKGKKAIANEADAKNYLSEERYGELITRHRARWDDVDETRRVSHEALVNELGAQLDGLAKEIAPRPGKSVLLFRETSVSNYRTQGHGAGGYAKVQAQLVGEHVKACGIDQYIVVMCSGLEYEYRVMVKVEAEIDVEIIKRKPGRSFREQLKACLKRGVNPRVLFGNIPWGTEAKLGLDNFGNDIPPSTS